MSAKFYEEIIDNYKKLYETKEDYDVKIYSGEKPNIKEFHVHSFVLKTQSEFFKKVFTTKDGVEKKDDYFIINSSNSSIIFEILFNILFLKIENFFSCLINNTDFLFYHIKSYMYCGSVDLTKLQPLEILNLLLPSNEFELQPLVTYIQEILILNNYDFIIKNILEIIKLTYQQKLLIKLWGFCIQEICYEPDCLFKSTKFLTLNPAILEIILKRDDFNIDNEIVIWENLLKWMCEQQPVIQQNINKWNRNDFTVMERRLSRFIPSIRFYQISSEDFLLKIYPFKEILPNDLVNNVLAYHMAPNNNPNINMQLPRCPYSTIINFQHLNIFTNWIEKKEILDYNKVNYKFKLIYRASRDGNTIAAFHEKCDNKGATIVIAKVTNSKQIIGG